jgi:hypothetical protein
MTIRLHRLAPAIFLLAFLVGLWNLWQRSGIQTGAGIKAAGAPYQTASDRRDPFGVNGYQLTPVAQISWRARVLSVEPYSWDAGAAISPVDVALGWDRMSDESVLSQLKITQGQRFFTYRYQRAPIPQAEIERSAANVHMIPATDDVAAVLKRARPGEILEMKGYLVNVRGPQSFTWNTSLVRDDTGPGACEIVYVEWVQVTRR